MFALLNVFALHACVLALSVAWQAYIQDAPHLYVTAAIALVFKAHRHPGRAAPDRARGSASTARSRPWSASASTMLAGMGLVALVDGGDAAGVTPTPTRWRARISPSRCRSCCSAC